MPEEAVTKEDIKRVHERIDAVFTAIKETAVALATQAGVMQGIQREMVASNANREATCPHREKIEALEDQVEVLQAQVKTARRWGSVFAAIASAAIVIPTVAWLWQTIVRIIVDHV